MENTTQLDVDAMILDYLVCMAIHQILSPTDQYPDNEIDWLVDSVQSFHATRHKQSPDDLETKLRLFTVADQLRRYTRAVREHRPNPSQMATIATDFMDLCSAAGAKVSESRWLDVGARFMAQVTLEEGLTPDHSEALRRFYAWTPDNSEQRVMWENTCQKYLTERTSLPIQDLEYLVMDFLGDLMMTLDPPILIQLERGKLGSLSRAETQQLKERTGLH